MQRIGFEVSNGDNRASHSVTLHSNPGISAFCNQSFSDNSLQFYGIEIPECCTQIPDEVRVKVCPGFECKSGATWKPRGKRTGSWL
jgi:hypothetical protein